MSLSCSCNDDDCAWYYYTPNDFSTLATKRSRKCCSCGSKITPGDECVTFSRYKSPESEVRMQERKCFGRRIPFGIQYTAECRTCASPGREATES